MFILHHVKANIEFDMVCFYDYSNGFNSTEMIRSLSGIYYVLNSLYTFSVLCVIKEAPIRNDENQ